MNSIWILNRLMIAIVTAVAVMSMLGPVLKADADRYHRLDTIQIAVCERQDGSLFDVQYLSQAPDERLAKEICEIYGKEGQE